MKTVRITIVAALGLVFLGGADCAGVPAPGLTTGGDVGPFPAGAYSGQVVKTNRTTADGELVTDTTSDPIPFAWTCGEDGLPRLSDLGAPRVGDVLVSLGGRNRETIFVVDIATNKVVVSLLVDQVDSDGIGHVTGNRMMIFEYVAPATMIYTSAASVSGIAGNGQFLVVDLTETADLTR